MLPPVTLPTARAEGERRARVAARAERGRLVLAELADVDDALEAVVLEQLERF